MRGILRALQEPLIRHASRATFSRKGRRKKTLRLKRYLSKKSRTRANTRSNMSVVSTPVFML